MHTDSSRRELMLALGALGISCPIFARALVVEGEKSSEPSVDSIAQAAWIAGLELSEADRKAVLGILRGWQRSFKRFREMTIGNAAPMPLVFNPAPGLAPSSKTGSVSLNEKIDIKKPESESELAFLSLAELAVLLRQKKVSSVELTKLYLARLKEFDPKLFCVVTLTEKTGLAQAEAADKEIAAGKLRGPLHGIPWGAKDLMAYPGYPTTWGAEPYKEQTLEAKATVAQRLDDAGAVLVAKLSLGALAWGDRWFGDRMTRNPWNPKTGSSGSSAGSASATAAGLVGFAIGTETLGSIISPSRVCGVSGLRPTFGRVSRAGCMTLAWSMDKLGPMCRSVEDCALVFGQIHGRDGIDGSVVDHPFSWPATRDIKTLKVGYVEGSALDAELKVLKGLGMTLVPIKLPSKNPQNELTVIMHTECAAAFDELTNTGMPDGPNNWKPYFQAGRFVSAVDYLRANRIRGLLMQEMAELMKTVDVYVGRGQDLVLTNFTGHPQVVLPSGFGKSGGVEVPRTIVFTGQLFGESDLLSVAHHYQRETGHHRKHPKLG
jgi:Asp-tRNA(Asn)/Glu-tRNA(Gln) amidotransferase A subunit family amidase